MSKQNPIDSKSLKSIMNKRILVIENAEGKRVKFYVQGNGNIIDVLDKDGNVVTSSIKGQEGIVLQKKIFNLRANSHLAMGLAINRQLLIDGMAAEKAGDAAKADEFFNGYLNAVQMSFGIILPSAVAEKLSSGEEIAATVTKVTTDRGSLLTIDPSTISIVAPEVMKATEFSMDDFLPKAEVGAEIAAPVEV